MLVILGILGFFILKIEDVKVSRTGNHKKVTAIFDSVAGLDKGSAVRVAGVRVGKITKIDLRPDGKADRRMDAGELLVAGALPLQPFDAAAVGFARAERPDVETIAFERMQQRRIVDLRVVRQRHKGRVAVDAQWQIGRAHV